MYHRHQQPGVVWVDHDGWRIPDVFTAMDAEVAGLRASAGLTDVSWMVKFDVKGRGLGRPLVLGDDAYSWVLGPSHCLVTCEPSARAATSQRLDALRAVGPDAAEPPLIYTTDVTSVYGQLLLCGPRAREVLNKLTSVDVSDGACPNLSCRQTSVAHVVGMLLRQDVGGLPGFHVLVGREYAESVWDSIMHAGHEFHLAPFGRQAQRALKA